MSSEKYSDFDVFGAEPSPEAKFGKRRRYDVAFKRRAVQMLIESGKPITAVALSVGVDHSILYRWKKKYGFEFEKAPQIISGVAAGQKEFITLKNEIESIKNTVSHLRTIVQKSFSRKYLGTE
jgi:transposase-like protein